MFVLRVLGIAAALVFITPASAEEHMQLAKAELGDPDAASQDANNDASIQDEAESDQIDLRTRVLEGHQSLDAALPPAAEAKVPEEVEQAKPLARPEPTLFADINLTTQRMTVRDSEGNEYGPWKISSARGGYRTPTGTYTVNWTSRMHYSKQYHNSPMPYSVFFNEGIATHGTGAVGALGRPASHGCVRLHTSNAKTFYNLVEKHGTKLTKIVVHGTPPYSPAVADRPARRRYAQPTFQPFFFGAPPPSYQQKRKRRYGGGYY